MLGRDKGYRRFPRTPFSARGLLPPLSFGQVPLDEGWGLFQGAAEYSTFEEIRRWEDVSGGQAEIGRFTRSEFLTRVAEEEGFEPPSESPH